MARRVVSQWVSQSWSKLKQSSRMHWVRDISIKALKIYANLHDSKSFRAYQNEMTCLGLTKVLARGTLANRDIQYVYLPWRSIFHYNITPHLPVSLHHRHPYKHHISSFLSFIFKKKHKNRRINYCYYHVKEYQRQSIIPIATL